MGLNPIAVLGAVAAAGGALGAGALTLAGAAAPAAAVGGLIAAFGAAAAGQVWRNEGERLQLEAAFAETRAELADVAERQAQSEARMAEIERRTIESPALVWRAATADIEVLGSLVSNLAKAVEEHERRLGAPSAQASSGTAAPPSPDLFEDEAELGFTADAFAPTAGLRTAARGLNSASPAVIAELKTTLAVALASDRLELCLQPVVALPQRSTRGYEATLRLKGEAGDLQGDAELRRIAAATGMEPELDRALVERAVQVLRILRARNREATAICVVSGASLASETFRATLESLARADAALIGAVTLELSEADFRALDAPTQEAMRGLAAKGVGFGLCRLPEHGFDAAEATVAGVRQLRVPAEALLKAAQGGGRLDIHPVDLAEFLRRRGVELLVSEVETEQTVLDLLDLAVPLAVGPLFGVARPVRPEVLEPKAVAETPRPAAEPAAGAEPPAPPRPQRQSFRSLLRRA